jgi:hypothetical protein
MADSMAGDIEIKGAGFTRGTEGRKQKTKGKCSFGKHSTSKITMFHAVINFLAKLDADYIIPACY